uniref:TATA box-binding protein-associated factor RNA polymerase I subunit B n=1 Tax=Cuerna arida TaxID=1464854 RepID=A0A1B6FI01_9HEMI
MSQPNITCTVCGGTEFTLDAGFFFCLECHTQSQDVREEVFDDFFGNQKFATKVLTKATSAPVSSQNVKLTSWEVLNYVMKGLVEELINLGAKPELKIVTLQLWASYLRKLDIAFTSVDVERKPKLGYAFKNSDAEIIYGVTKQQLKEKSWRTRSKSSSAASSTSRNSSLAETNTSVNKTLSRRSILLRLAHRKKSLASAEYQTLSQETTQSNSQTLEDLSSASVTSIAPKRIKVTAHTKSILNSSCASSTDCDEERIVRRRMARSEVQSLRNVTTAKVVAIVNVALALTRQDIQVSDFLRWVEEGHISLKTSRIFLPDGITVDGNVQRMIELDHLSYIKCQNLINGICNELDIDELPPPRLSGLADRYCLELQLPDEVTNIVKRLLLLSTSSHGLLKKSNVHTYRYSEVQVMSAIVMVLKLLFSLDDCTEFQLSHTAAQINRVTAVENISRRQFVFSEWMRYLECRKATVSSYHLPTRSAVYGKAVDRDPQLFLHHLGQTEFNAPQPVKRQYEALNKVWMESLRQCLQKLTEQPSQRALVKFPPSLTPLLTCTQYLLTQHAELVAPVAHVLEQDFTSQSLDYIIHPDRCIALGLTHDLNIVQQRGSAATFIVDKIKPGNRDSTVLPRYKINEVTVTVKIVDNLKQAGNLSFNKTSESAYIDEIRGKLSELVSDDTDEEENDYESGVFEGPQIHDVTPSHSIVELFNTGSQYWFCHTKLDKNSLSLDEFEEFAMNTFPSSFLWLLKECSRMICVPIKDLYANIISLEKNYKYILNEAHFLACQGRNKRKRD